MKTPIRFWRGPCGALLCDRELRTQISNLPLLSGDLETELT
jgi:hypothetical protein